MSSPTDELVDVHVHQLEDEREAAGRLIIKHLAEETGLDLMLELRIAVSTKQNAQGELCCRPQDSYSLEIFEGEQHRAKP